jgi:DNA adenine methylase
MAYPGGKDGAGVWQKIVNEMPPHDVFISAFLGDCAVMRHKRAAGWNVGIDRDEAAIRFFMSHCPAWLVGSLDLYCADAVGWLSGAFDLGRILGPVRADGTVGRFRVPRERVLVYADPPYVLGSRKSGRRRYRFEMTDGEHLALLHVFRQLPCLVVVSHYPCRMYDEGLASWRSCTFEAATRGGRATEKVWLNFPALGELHDVRFLGRDKREREKLRRRRGNLMRRLRALSAVERQSILAELDG